MARRPVKQSQARSPPPPDSYELRLRRSQFIQVVAQFAIAAPVGKVSSRVAWVLRMRGLEFHHLGGLQKAIPRRQSSVKLDVKSDFPQRLDLMLDFRLDNAWII